MLEKLTETVSVWDRAKSCGKPVVLYGMGNGADMVFDVLDGIGVTVSDVFASDNFVRGHSFHGFRVLKYADICEKYDDFLILMTFAVHDKDTMERVKQMSEQHELLSPTVPVAGKGLFTLDYIKENEALFDRAFGLLADEKSRFDFISVLNFKISGKVKYLFDCESEKAQLYSTVFPLREDEIIVDLGAYDGDTIREFTAVTNGKYRKIYAFEPDEKNFRKLQKNTEDMENISLFNIGAWDCEQTLYFSKKAGRNSHTSEKQNGVPVLFNSVDNVIDGEVTFIKMDIEGAESRALSGAAQTIKKYKPKLYVCAYHRNEDAFALPIKINELCGEYKIYYRHHPYIPAWESNFYCVL
ncbi:MAG: FkbM family methyltransferase [Clostridia bacterium]|nr:FkbM family methyltransferase [Clostridia bacterium]